MRLGYRIGKVCDYLIEESAHRDALRSRLTHELDGTLKVMVEPVQTALSVYPERYNSASEWTIRICIPIMPRYSSLSTLFVSLLQC